MGLLDDAVEASQVRYPRCSIARIEDDDLRAEVEEALALLDTSTAITGEGLSKALAKRGVTIKAHTLRRHQRGDCSCGPG